MLIIPSSWRKYFYSGCLFLGCSCFAEDSRLDLIQKELPDAFRIFGVAGIDGILKSFDLQSNRLGEAPPICNGRLTLTSGTAVTTSDVTAASTIYFTPYNGSKIALYSGSAWQVLTFSEGSVAVPSTTDTNFDVFGYNNSGTLSLETVNWTDSTTRATALTTQDGVLVKSGATTRRYLGTGRTTGASGQSEDSAAKRLVWNNCNRVTKPIKTTPSVASWTYGTAAYRSSGNDATFRIQFVVGWNEVPIDLKYHSTTSATCDRINAICLDCTNSNSALAPGYNHVTDGDYFGGHTEYAAYVGVGFHYLQATELAYSCTVSTSVNLTFMIGRFEC